MTAALDRSVVGFRPGMTLDRSIAPWKEPFDEALMATGLEHGKADEALALFVLAAFRVANGSVIDLRQALRVVAPDVSPNPRLLAKARSLVASLDCSLPDEVPPLRLLPYVLDPHVVGTRLRVMREQGRADARTLRKESGAFFTPPDLAEHMVELALQGNPATGAVLDPACGSGVFLAAALRWLASQDPGAPPAEILERLRGTDVDPRCVLAARIVLAAQVASFTGDSILDQWAAASSCVAERDAFEADHLEGVAAVVMNPPYGALGGSNDLEAVGRSVGLGPALTRGTPAFAPFVALGLRIAQVERARLVVVVPLAISCNTTRPFPALRSLMQSAGGRLRISFFDRTPDSIFGDHVKTRAAIIEWDPNGSGVAVTPLVRWSSGSRHRLFRTLKYTDLASTTDIADGIPRLRSDLDATAFEQLRRCSGAAPCSAMKVARSEAVEDDRQVFVAGTAYNWLTVLRSATSVRQSDSMSPVHALTFASPNEADAAFAIIASRVLYWRWATSGDAFHTTRRFLCDIPWPTDRSDVTELADLGREIWPSMLERPVVSVNKGRTTVSFDPETAPEIRDKIDHVLGRAFGLSEVFTAGLRPWLASHVDAGRQHEGDMS